MPIRLEASRAVVGVSVATWSAAVATWVQILGRGTVFEGSC